ncbi:hypothetical protein C0J52_24622, partial [Blattella germanica]
NGETHKSKLAEHSWETGRRIQWDIDNIIRKEENVEIRKLKESTFFRVQIYIVISQSSIDISPMWRPLIKSEIEKSRVT